MSVAGIPLLGVVLAGIFVCISPEGLCFGLSIFLPTRRRSSDIEVGGQVFTSY